MTLNKEELTYFIILPTWAQHITEEEFYKMLLSDLQIKRFILNIEFPVRKEQFIPILDSSNYSLNHVKICFLT